MGLFYQIFYESFQDAQEDFINRYESHMVNILEDYANGVPQIKWNRIKAPRLIKIWKDFANTGIIRDEKGLNIIRQRLLSNIARLAATNELTGHSDFGGNAREILDQYEIDGIELEGDEDYPEFPEKFYYDYLSGDDSDFISDYGYPKLEKLYPEIYNAEGEELLYFIDKALNVVHQRSDLSSLFIEGGQQTLNQIADYQGNVEE